MQHVYSVRLRLARKPAVRVRVLHVLQITSHPPPPLSSPPATFSHSSYSFVPSFSSSILLLKQRVLNYLYNARLSRGRIIWLLGHPVSPSPACKLDRRHTGRLRKRDNLLGGRGGQGAESYNRKKACSSINRSILSASNTCESPIPGPPLPIEKLMKRQYYHFPCHVQNYAAEKAYCPKYRIVHKKGQSRSSA
jgi:hypothetical protein